MGLIKYTLSPIKGYKARKYDYFMEDATMTYTAKQVEEIKAIIKAENTDKISALKAAKTDALKKHVADKSMMEVIKNLEYTFTFDGKERTAYASAAAMFDADLAKAIKKSSPTITDNINCGLYARIKTALANWMREERDGEKPENRKTLEKYMAQAATVYGVEGYKVNAWHTRYMQAALVKAKNGKYTVGGSVEMALQFVFSHFLNGTKPAIENGSVKLSKKELAAIEENAMIEGLSYAEKKQALENAAAKKNVA